MGAKWCNQSITENKLRHTQTIELVAICDQFSFILMFYIICHISIFIFKVAICDLNVLLLIIVCKGSAFSL